MSDTMVQEEAMNMSNEQAVQILIPMRNMMCDRYGCPVSDAVFALDKAIEALSADKPQAEWRDSDGNFVPLDEDGCTTASAWCSNCGEWLTGSDEYWTSGRFCPNCGYQMRKE